MMQIDCPFCGRRDETEFAYGGESHIVRPALDVDDRRWTDYLWFRDNTKGVHAERWRHARGCGQWFNALRNTATHQFVAFYRITESRPDVKASAPAAIVPNRGGTPTLAAGSAAPAHGADAPAHSTAAAAHDIAVARQSAGTDTTTMTHTTGSGVSR